MVVPDRADDTMRHLASYWETFRQKDDPKGRTDTAGDGRLRSGGCYLRACLQREGSEVVGF